MTLVEDDFGSNIFWGTTEGPRFATGGNFLRETKIALEEEEEGEETAMNHVLRIVDAGDQYSFGKNCFVMLQLKLALFST